MILLHWRFLNVLPRVLTQDIEYTRITFNLVSSGLLADSHRSKVHIAVSSNAVSLFSTTVNCLDFSEITHNIARSKFESLLNDSGSLALNVAVSITTLDLPFETKTSVRSVGTQVIDNVTSEVGTQVTLKNVPVKIKAEKEPEQLSSTLDSRKNLSLKKAKAAQEFIEWERKVDQLAMLGLKNQLDVIKFSSLAIHIKSKVLQRRMLGILANGNLISRQIYIDNRGLNIIFQWMKSLDMVNSLDSLKLSIDLMDTLRLLPISNIAILLTPNIINYVERWMYLRLDHTQKVTDEMGAELQALKRKVQTVATELLQKWENMKRGQKAGPKKPRTMSRKTSKVKELKEKPDQWLKEVPVMGINSNKCHILEVVDIINQTKSDDMKVAQKSDLMQDSKEGVVEELTHQNKKFKSF